MRVAFVYDLIYPFSKGGVEKRILDLGYELKAKGHEVHVFGTKHWNGPGDLVRDGIYFHGVCEPTRIHTSSGRRSVWQAGKFAVAAARAVARSRFDVIEVQAMSPLSCLAVVATSRLRSGNPLVVWYEVWQRYWNEYLGLLGYIGRLVEWTVAKVSPSNTATCHETMRRLNEWGLTDVVVCPLGIDFNRIQSVSPDAFTSELVYVGRLAKHKNLGLLLDALSLLKADGITPSTLIIGEGPERERLERYAAARGLNNVQFIGRVESDDKVFALMKASQLFVFPSLREGFGLAPLEAGASGLPVVGVRHPDNATTDLIADGVNGVLTTADSRNFAAAISGLLEDQGVRAEMSQRARIIAESYEWEKVVNQVEQTYVEAMRRHRQRNRVGSARHTEPPKS